MPLLAKGVIWDSRNGLRIRLRRITDDRKVAKNYSVAGGTAQVRPKIDQERTSGNRRSVRGGHFEGAGIREALNAPSGAGAMQAAGGAQSNLGVARRQGPGPQSVGAKADFVYETAGRAGVFVVDDDFDAIAGIEEERGNATGRERRRCSRAGSGAGGATKNLRQRMGLTRLIALARLLGAIEPEIAVLFVGRIDARARVTPSRAKVGG